MSKGVFIRWVRKLGITANWLSWLGLILAGLAGVLIVRGNWMGAALSVALSGLMDIWDGRFARETQTQNKYGSSLDSTLDRYSDFLVCAGLGLFFRTEMLWLGMALFCILGSFMMSYSSAKAEAIQLEINLGSMKRPVRWTMLMAGLFFTSFTAPSLIPIKVVLVVLAIFTNLLSVVRLQKLLSKC